MSSSAACGVVLSAAHLAITLQLNTQPINTSVSPLCGCSVQQSGDTDAWHIGFVLELASCGPCVLGDPEVFGECPAGCTATCLCACLMLLKPNPQVQVNTPTSLHSFNIPDQLQVSADPIGHCLALLLARPWPQQVSIRAAGVGGGGVGGAAAAAAAAIGLTSACAASSATSGMPCCSKARCGSERKGNCTLTPTASVRGHQGSQLILLQKVGTAKASHARPKALSLSISTDNLAALDAAAAATCAACSCLQLSANPAHHTCC